MNNYNAIGRVGKDAVTRNVGDDVVTGWSMAVDSGFGKNKQTLWWDCSLWGKRGEKVADYIVKGAQLGVSGEVGTREHDGKTYLTLRIADVTLIGGKQESKAETKRGETYKGGIRQDADPDFADDDMGSIPF